MKSERRGIRSGTDSGKESVKPASEKNFKTGHRVNTRSCLSVPSSDSQLSISLSNNHLQVKVAALASEQTQKVDWLALIHRHLACSSLVAWIPECLVLAQDGRKYVYVAREEGLGVFSGESVEMDFLSAASIKNRQLRNLNPLGIRYPKFLSFRSGTLECTFVRKKAVKLYLRQAPGPYTLQRYIVPEHYTVKKHVIHWRRTKPANVYVLSSRLPLQSATLQQGLEADYAFVVSTHCIEQCDVTQESLGEAHMPIVETVRTTLEQTLGAKMEEFAVEAIKSQDGKWYIVDVPWVKGSIPPLPMEISSKEDISRELLLRLSQKPVPVLVSNDQLSASISCYDHSRLCRPKPVSLTSPILAVAQGLAEISSKLDHIRSESVQLKKEASLIMKLNLAKDVLTRVIHRVYESILRDSRLSRYYMDKSRVYTKVEGAVRLVFQCGASRILKTRVKAIHKHMGITEHDFELYLRYFTEALAAEMLSQASIDLTIRFLSEFKDVIVQSN